MTSNAARRQLLLDYAQVISFAPTAADVAGLAEVAALPVAEFTDRYWTHRAPYDRGGSALGYWTEVLGVAPTADRLRRLIELDITGWLRLDPAVVAVLDGFHAAGVPVSLLSNLPHELAAAVAALPPFARFRRLLFSCQLGLVKPDPRIFSAAAERLGAEPAEVLFVDDRPDNVRAAAAVGMHAVTYTGSADCLDRLRPAVLGG